MAFAPKRRAHIRKFYQLIDRSMAVLRESLINPGPKAPESKEL